MKIHFRAFTLIELIVSITISTLLMASVMFFITYGMKNIATQRDILEKGKDQDIMLEQILRETNSASNKNLVKTFGSWAMMKIESDFYHGGFLYVWEKSLKGEYCQSGASITTTNHIVFFPFLPYEGEGGDIFAWFSSQVGNVKTSYFSGSILFSWTKLLWDYSAPTGFDTFGQDLYVADTWGHQVLKFNTNTPLTAWIKVIGTGIAGNAFSEWSQADKISLNSPTGIAIWEGKVFVSDTLNNRVLYYDIPTKKIFTLLDESSWLKEPSGLLYDSGSKSLFIVNSGKWEVLKIQSQSVWANPNLTLNIQPWVNIMGVDNFSIDFFSTSGNVSGTPSFTGFNSGSDYFTGTTDRIDYYFSNFSTLEWSSGITFIPGCSNHTDYYLEGGDMKKDAYNCASSSTGTIDKYSGTLNTNLLAGNSYQIRFTNITGNFSKNLTYYVKLSLYDAATKVRESYFPYFINGDGYVTTKDNNVFTTFISGLSYPTGIYKSAGNMVIHDFVERKAKLYDINSWAFISENSLSGFDFSKIDAFAKNIWKTPLKKLDINLNGSLLNLNIEYYKSFSCEGEKSENIARKILFKKALK